MATVNVQISCKCGANQATTAAFAQMSGARQQDWLKRVRQCSTCQRDRTAGRG